MAVAFLNCIRVARSLSGIAGGLFGWDGHSVCARLSTCSALGHCFTAGAAPPGRKHELPVLTPSPREGLYSLGVGGLNSSVLVLFVSTGCRRTAGSSLERRRNRSRCGSLLRRKLLPPSPGSQLELLGGPRDSAASQGRRGHTLEDPWVSQPSHPGH